MKSQYKNIQFKDSMGRWRINSLFWELRTNETDYPPIFTIKESTYNGYPSLKEIYFSYDHVPFHEYEFAMDVFGSWEHWKAITNSSSCKDMMTNWRDELTIRNKARAVKQIIAIAREDSATGLSAARYLSDEGFLPKRAGRTTKEEKIRQQKIDAGVHTELNDDFKRMSLKVVN